MNEGNARRAERGLLVAVLLPTVVVFAGVYAAYLYQPPLGSNPMKNTALIAGLAIELLAVAAYVSSSRAPLGLRLVLAAGIAAASLITALAAGFFAACLNGDCL